MTQQELPEIVPGTVIEFFESREILCGVCQATKNKRLTVLTEENREINLAQSRIIFASRQPLRMEQSRDRLVQKLQEITALRKGLMEQVDVEELWSLLESEEEGFDPRDLAELVFSGAVTEDHVAAVQRILLQDRLFFQLKDGQFFARSQEKVEQRRLELERIAEKEAQLGEGALWLQAVWNRKPSPRPPENQNQVIEALKSFCLFGNESPEQNFAKELLKRANITQQPQSAFRLLVRLGIWSEDENLFLLQQGISTEFPQNALELAASRVESMKCQGEVPESGMQNDVDDPRCSQRQDLRDLHTFTIDSALTRDYDDALSLRALEDGFWEVGVHIADAAQFVSRGDLLDQEAQSRVSTLYLPDTRVPMLPVSISEGACSLKAGQDRLALSFLMRMDEQGRTHDSRIVSSIVRVHEQLTYEEVNKRVEKEPLFATLHQLCLKRREERLACGAIILPLPEIQVYVNDVGMVQISYYEKETPSQIIVSELMIAANGLAASYLAERNIPAIFRGQAECKPETQHIASEYEIFHFYRQRRLFSRAELDTQPKMHCSLGMACYTSVTSPIRRYVDLIIQRQLKHAIETGEAFYTEEELSQLVTQLEALQSKLVFIHRKSNRYWILKYMEQEDIDTLNALVLDQNNRFTHLLIPDFLIETNMPLPEKNRPQPGEMIRVKVERVNPREDILRVQL